VGQAVLGRTQLGAGGADGLQGVIQLADSGGGVGGVVQLARGGHEVVDLTQLGGDVHRHGLGRGGAALEAQRAGQLATGGEQGLAAVGGVVQDVAQFVDQRGVLGGQRGAVVIGGGAVGGLGGQVLHAQHDVGELLEGALGGLHQRDAVL